MKLANIFDHNLGFGYYAYLDGSGENGMWIIRGGALPKMDHIK